jgi:hypothetical protein
VGITRDELVAHLTRAGELEVSGEDQAETSYEASLTLMLTLCCSTN